MKKKIILIISLLCLVSCLACAGIMSFAGNGDENNNIHCKNNTITIFYKGFSNPYIHYQVGNGDWTYGIGNRMSASSVIKGFPFVYTINLGSEDTATVCFNDGNGNWDSNYMKNYTFKTGIYTYTNGTIQPYHDEMLVSAKLSNLKTGYYPGSAAISIYGGEAPYYVEYNIIKPTLDPYNTTNSSGNYTLNWSFDEKYQSYSLIGGSNISVYCNVGGKAIMYVKVTDANGNTAEATTTYEIPKFTVTNIVPSVESPQKVGTEIKLTPEFKDAYCPKYSVNSVSMPETYTISKKGSDEITVIKATRYLKEEAIWTPTEPGVYDIKLEMLDYSKQSSTYSIEYIIE